MTISSDGFRQALSRYPTGVAVVAAGDGDRIHAMTVGSFTSVSLEPALVLFCVARKARMAGLLDVGRELSVNVLRADQRSLSTFFAGGWREPKPPPHRFVHWNGVPRLEGVALSLGGRVVALPDGGDHVIVVVQIEAIHQGLPPIEPLVFFDRRYHGVGGAGESAPELDPADPSAQLFHDTW